MAINSNGILKDKHTTNSLCSSNTSNISSCRLIQINFAGKDTCSSSKANKQNNSKDIKSPYLTNDKVQMLSRVSGKKVAHKKPTEFVSSFPLAVSVYKANSDEFKVKKQGNKKVKKSVLTLPNEPAPMPKTYTVSDLNDSECFANEDRANKQKKRRSVKRTKKPRVKERAMEFYDRDARYCSQLNIDLDCSSSEIVDITGDGERISKLSYESNNSVNVTNDPHDVWTVLRNINKFQFRPSPPESQESVVPLRKRRPLVRKGNNCNDTRIIETCHTEEFAYISSFEIDSKSRETCSPSSSFDRVTVIDKQSEQDDIMNQFSQKIFGSNFKRKEKNKIFGQNWSRNKPRVKDNNRKVSQNKMRLEDNRIAAHTTCHILQSNRDNAVTFCDNLMLPKFDQCDSGSIGEIESLPGDIDVIKSNNKRALMNSPNAEINVTKPIDNSEKQITGITKVILSKGQDIASSKLPNPPKKAHLAMILPNTNIPKLTQTEIKRRLANLKFPIVILGKDQITNCAIHIENTDPPQFDGLEKNIWPFMLEWYKGKRQSIQDSEQKEIVKVKSKTPKTKHTVSPIEGDISKYGIVLKKANEPKKIRNSYFPVTNRSTEQLLNDNASSVRNTKPMSLLKSKMFQFLNKSPTPTKIINNNNWSNNGQLQTVQKDKNVGTNGTIQNEIKQIGQGPSTPILTKEISKTSIENRLIKKSYSSLRHPWAKGKWASDFIENIIKKIRSGVYYGADNKEIIKKIHSIEVSTQTEINTSRNAYCQNGADIDIASNLILNKTDDPLENLPGFDKTFSTLEIETINTNQIAVKQCVTNVVVQFDIKVLAEANDLINKKSSLSCIPIDLKDKQEKIFKCTTSILNASLPAELCSIIPCMMRSILHVDKKLSPPPGVVLNVESSMTPISEFTGFESPEVTMHSILPGLTVPDQIRPILNGRFTSCQFNHKIISRTDFRLSTNLKDSIASVLALVNAELPWHIYHQSVNLHFISNFNSLNMLARDSNQSLNKTSNCMALQPYEPRNQSIIPYFGMLNTNNFMKKIIDKFNGIELFYTNSLKMKCYGHIYNENNIIVNRPIIIPKIKSINTILLTPMSNVGVISLFNSFTKSNNNVDAFLGNTLNDSTQTGIENKVETCTKCKNNKSDVRKKGQPNKVLRMKSYVKCYRKCNSMSSISSYKCTQLNKITNLDDFCQVLGSSSFCSVLDGCLNKKILGALAEMKNWITEITSKQALLILLLMNKKDTPNLIRFRPVLLQGIAVNRITRAFELDTEIEVIERENFNKISQYEGISYLPASAENQDNLLEELYWIAKTTASDYQKTFDESSEKLLKSLLQKRKKLNPSYLRVMARYVGLGLLKPAK